MISLASDWVTAVLPFGPTIGPTVSTFWFGSFYVLVRQFLCLTRSKMVITDQDHGFLPDSRVTSGSAWYRENRNAWVP